VRTNANEDDLLAEAEAIISGAMRGTDAEATEGAEPPPMPAVHRANMARRTAGAVVGRPRQTDLFA
jgi:hypothetical protein